MLQQLYGRYHELVDHYTISLFQMAMDPSHRIYLFKYSITGKTFATLSYMSNTATVTAYTLPASWFTLGVLVEFIFLVFDVGMFGFVCFCTVFCALCWLCLWIFNFRLPLGFSLTFIFLQFELNYPVELLVKWQSAASGWTLVRLSSNFRSWIMWHSRLRKCNYTLINNVYLVSVS